MDEKIRGAIRDVITELEAAAQAATRGIETIEGVPATSHLRGQARAFEIAAEMLRAGLLGEACPAPLFNRRVERFARDFLSLLDEVCERGTRGDLDMFHETMALIGKTHDRGIKANSSTRLALTSREQLNTHCAKLLGFDCK